MDGAAELRAVDVYDIVILRRVGKSSRVASDHHEFHFCLCCLCLFGLSPSLGQVVSCSSGTRAIVSVYSSCSCHQQITMWSATPDGGHITRLVVCSKFFALIEHQLF